MVEVTRQRGWGLGVGRGSGPESSVLGEQYVPPQEGVSAFTGWSTQSNRELSLGGDRGPWGYLEDGSLDPKSIGKALQESDTIRFAFRWSLCPLVGSSGCNRLLQSGKMMEAWSRDRQWR